MFTGIEKTALRKSFFSPETGFEKAPKPYIVVFTGESGSGKTTLLKALEQEDPQYKRLITYTSRSPRPGEIDGIDYHFRDPNFFRNNPELTLVKKTIDGTFYATAKKDLEREEGLFNLATYRPEGIQSLLNQNYLITHIHIHVEEGVKIERMRERGDTEEAIEARLVSDKEYRDSLQHLLSNNTIDTTFIDAETSLEEKVKQVQGILNK